MEARTPSGLRRARRLALVVLLLAAGAAMAVAALRTSATFDEIVLVSAGARGLETGRWSLLVDQPPLMALLYAAPLQVAGARYPSEAGAELGYDDRWSYARAFYFEANDPERIARLSRSVGIVLALGLIVLAWGYGRWAEGPGTALLAAFLVAFLPDVLAHGAVAYNDLPLALAFLGAVWALDATVRRPGVARAVSAGAAVGLALGVKFSALALGPVAVALVAAEAVGTRGREPRWWVRIGVATAVAVATTWVVLVLLYRGDWMLLAFERGLRFTLLHASEGHPAPAYLFGRTSPDGWWSFFPVAFFLKTPAALHLLLPLGVAGLLLAATRADGPAGGRVRGLLRSRLRGPVVALLVFGAFLVRSDLNVGFRYALPALPPLLLLVAAGTARLHRRLEGRRRLAVALLLLLYGGSTLSTAPWFLSYRSEWIRARPPGDEALLDSSVDWGQGLLALRDFMDEEGVDRVRLSYFGSALPEAYGIGYEALPSFLRLPGGGAPGSDPVPEWTVISATNLHGLYFPDADPFAAWRDRTPDRVLAGSLYLYGEPPPGDG